MTFELVLSLVFSIFSSAISELFIIYILSWFMNNRKLAFILTIGYAVLMIGVSIFFGVKSFLLTSSVLVMFHTIFSYSTGPVIVVIFLRIFWKIPILNLRKAKYQASMKKATYIVPKSATNLYSLLLSLPMIGIGVGAFFIIKNDVIKYIIISVSLLFILILVYYVLFYSKKTKEYIVLIKGRMNTEDYIKEVTKDVKRIEPKDVINNDLYYVDYLAKVFIKHLDGTREIEYIYVLETDAVVDLSKSLLTRCVLPFKDLVINLKKYNDNNLTIVEKADGYHLAN